MKIIDFTSTRFSEIPDQDNPALDYTSYSGEILRIQECIMVCRVADHRHSGVGEGFTVMHVPPSGDIVSKGRFWTSEMAMVFAGSLSDLLSK